MILPLSQPTSYRDSSIKALDGSPGASYSSGRSSALYFGYYCIVKSMNMKLIVRSFVYWEPVI